ncbi:beta strand repeat-containing protein, partial [Flavobacterium sp. XS1P27]|uniref:beta strand repeat-containing protein n=1 Tax=Flavobacterium sp. XS1P27 TaxID=3401724 RepID=UPI003AAC7FE4
TVASNNTVVTALNALANDTLSGIAATTTNTNVTPLTTGPLSINADGIVTVAANTPSGTYTISYQLCEADPSTGLNVTPANCDTATATVIVSNPTDAVNDPSVTVASNNTIVTALNALANDTLSGIAATTTNTNVTPLTTGPLSINADGIVTVAANTPSGTYTISYQLCEAYPSTGLNVTPANCDTATATVVVFNPTDAVNDPSVTVASNNTVVTALNALANDTLSGIAATTTNTNVTPLTTGPLSINADGIVTVAANTPSGTYTISYQLCEADPSTGLNVTPANCDTATATVVVFNPIDAVNDPSVTVASNNTIVTALNALANDTLSGIAVTTTNTNVAPGTNGPLSIDANGIVTVAANTPSGSYSITYQLCEANSLTGLNVTQANCDNATATVIVLNPIDALNDGPTTVASSSIATTVQNVTANDTLNGIVVTSANTDITPSTSGPLSVDSNGVLTLAANTPSGTYTITYQLCEFGASPPNCDTAIATVVVQNPLMGFNDGPVTVATSNLPKIVLNVTTNDTLHGDLVTDANTNVTPSTSGPLSISSTGDITLAGNTPSGTYTLTYEICEVGADPANCVMATATIVVYNDIVANTDSTGGLPGETTGSVLGNDTYSGIPPIDPMDVYLTRIDINPALTLNPDGTITIALGTPAGPQTLVYQICEIGSSPPNCSTATVTVEVFQAAVDAVVDDFTATPYTGGTGGVTTSVLNNDTINGNIFDPTEVLLSLSGTAPTGFVLNPDGTITIPTGQVSGTYIVYYQICEALNPTNCDIANAKILISNEIIANDDAFPTQVPGTTVATSVGSVLVDNGNGADELNGTAVTVANTNVTPITTGPLSIDVNGNLTLAPNTVSGTYSITYQLCEADADPVNCANAVATVVVLNPIDAINDNPAIVNTGVDSKIILNVTTNDTLNGVAVNPTNTNVTPITTGPLSIDSNGVLTLAGNTPSGTYTINYDLCEANPANGLSLSPANCNTAIATVVVLNPIDAVNDPSVTVASNNSIVTALNALTNDLLNGVAATPTNTNVTPISSGPLSIDVDGNVTVATNTASGTYTITYQLCEADSVTGLNVSATNCDTATATVVVSNIIDAVNDPSVTIASNNSDVVALNALTNDTLNGLAVSQTNTNVTALTTGPLSINVNGVVSVAPNTPSGTYSITYELCEADPLSGLNVIPSNCDTAIATVIVDNSLATFNDPFSVPAPIVNTVIGNVTANDTLNGILVTTSNTDVTPITAGPLSIDANGVLTLAANTTTGTYSVTYTICEFGATPSNCETAIATVVVDGTIDAINDMATVSTGVVATTVQDITINDTLNGQLVTAANTDVTPVTLGPLSINSNGILTLAANTPSGTYTITYELCEFGADPSNCDSATVTVIVFNSIDAVNDDFSATPVAVGETTATVIANDTLNGVTPVVIGTNPGEVTLTGVTVPTQLTLDTATGIITVNA